MCHFSKNNPIITRFKLSGVMAQQYTYSNNLREAAAGKPNR